MAILITSLHIGPSLTLSNADTPDHCRNMIDSKSHGIPCMSMYYAAGCAATSSDGNVVATATQPVVVYHPSEPTPLSMLSGGQISAAKQDDKTGTKRPKLWDALHTVRWPAVSTLRRLFPSAPCSPISLTWTNQHTRLFARWSTW